MWIDQDSIMNGHVPGNLPVLDGKNWSKWSVQMKALFGFQDVYEVVQNGIEEQHTRCSDKFGRI